MQGILDRLKGVTAAGRKMARHLAAYQALLSDPVNRAFARGKELARIKSRIEEFPDSELRKELADWHERESGLVRQAKDDFRFRFGSELASTLKETGLGVKGQLPVLRVGMFSLRIDFESGSAALFWGPEVERLKTGVGLAPGELVATLVRWTEDIRKRATEPELLRSRLHEAYERLRSWKGLEPGTRIPLVDVLGEMVLLMQPASFRANPARDKFVEYPRVRFSYDLYRLKASREATEAKDRLRLHVANFDATTRKTRALWVPDNEDGDGTHYSYVSFFRKD